MNEDIGALHYNTRQFQGGLSKQCLGPPRREQQQTSYNNVRDIYLFIYYLKATTEGPEGHTYPVGDIQKHTTLAQYDKVQKRKNKQMI